MVTSMTNSKQHTQSNNALPAVSEKKPLNKTNDAEELPKKRNWCNKNPPERNKMIMMDLIYWNPPNNPMSQEKEKKEADSVAILQPMEEEEEVDDPQDIPINESTDEPEAELPAEESLPGPRVKIGPNGEITIDQDSLVIRRRNSKQNTLTDVIQEVSECTYSSFRKKKPKHFWTDKETTKFYKALNTVGTDFSLMQNLFPKRTRQELKNKFKREERLNRKLVDIAIKDPQQFDLTGFDDTDSNYSSEEETSKRKYSLRDSSQRTKTRKRKGKKLNEVSFKESVSNGEFIINEDASNNKTKKPNIEHEDLPSKSRKNNSDNTDDMTVQTAENTAKTFTDSEVIKSRLVENPTFYNSSSTEETEISGKEKGRQMQSPERNESTGSSTKINDCKMSQLSPGQIVLLPGKTTNQEKILHVYVVSPPHPSSSPTSQLSPRASSPFKSCDLPDENEVK